MENVKEISPEKDLISIKLKDTGMGISDEDQMRLFEDYVQASSEVSKKYGGTGLGLAICRKLAHLMGGEIILESELGKGSTFILQVNSVPTVVDFQRIQCRWNGTL